MYIIILILLLVVLLYCKSKYNESFSTNKPYLISIFLAENHCQETDNLLATLGQHNLLDKVIVTCLDKKCFRYMKSNIKIKVNFFNSNVDKKHYNTVVFSNKLIIIHNLLQKYKKPILHINTDSVVLSDKLDLDIRNLLKKKFDMIFQSNDTEFNTSNKKSTGLMLLNNTKNTLSCLTKSIKLIKQQNNNNWNDQITMNHIINNNSKKYKIGIFNSKNYPNGYRYFNNLDTIYKYYKPIIVHNNNIKDLQNKINRFKKHNLWFLPKKVVICFFGLTRSLKYNIKYLQKNIFDVLKQNGFDYDIFIHTYKKTGLHNNNRANEFNTIIDNNEYKLLNPEKYEIDDEDDINEKIPFDLYKSHGDPWKNKYLSFHNYIKQLYSLYCVTGLWENNKLDYDAAIYIRPDVIVTKPLNIDNLLEYKQNTIYIPNHHHSGGYNDRFAYGSINTMITYGNRYKNGIEYSKKKIFHAESFLKYILDKNKHNVIFDNMIVCRLRSNNKISPQDLQLLNLNDQIKLLLDL